MPLSLAILGRINVQWHWQDIINVIIEPPNSMNKRQFFWLKSTFYGLELIHQPISDNCQGVIYPKTWELFVTQAKGKKPRIHLYSSTSKQAIHLYKVRWVMHCCGWEGYIIHHLYKPQAKGIVYVTQDKGMVPTSTNILDDEY